MPKTKRTNNNKKQEKITKKRSVNSICNDYETKKDASKQIVRPVNNTVYVNRCKDSTVSEECLDILLMGDAKAQNEMLRVQECLVKNLVTTDRDFILEEAIKNMTQFYEEEREHIKYSNFGELKLDKKKFYYTGFLLRKKPQGYGKLESTSAKNKYEGKFELGKKNDLRATDINGSEKYVGGFKMGDRHGDGEIHEKDTNRHS